MFFNCSLKSSSPTDPTNTTSGFSPAGLALFTQEATRDVFRAQPPGDEFNLEIN